jgi:capsular exopolysaccharide synthesis family protein
MKDTEILEIFINAPSAWEAASIANIIATEYQLYSRDYNRQEIASLRRFIQEQLRSQKEKLRNSEENLKLFKQENNIYALDEQVSQRVTEIAEIEALLSLAKVDRNSLLQRERTIKEQIDDRRENLSDDIVSLTSAYFMALQAELAQKKAEKVKYEVQVAGSVDVDRRLISGELVKLDRQITAIEEKLREEGKRVVESNLVENPFSMTQQLLENYLAVQTEVQAVTSRIQTLGDLLREMDFDYQNLPEKELQLARLERERLVDEETNMLLHQKLEETRIAEAGESENARILDAALQPEVPIKPKTRLNLIIGLLLGLGVGVGIVFLLEFLDNSVKSIEEIERRDMKVLGVIPTIATDELEKKLEARPDQSIESIEGRRIENRLITHLDPKSPISEAYRSIRTNIQFASIGQETKSLVVSSSGPKEGKSTTVANLAITMAQLGNKTLLIDADLRRPVVHSIFGIPKDDGLTQYLLQASSLDKAIKKTLIEGLDVMPCGLLPPNPSELLSSKAMDDLLVKIKQEYQIVLLDAPPVIAVTDAAVLSSKVDGTLLVVKAGKTRREAFDRACGLLHSVDANIVGVVLNSIRAEGKYGTPYYYYYSYYGGDKRSRRAKSY